MKILRFKTFDFQSFKIAYSKRCEEQRDRRPVDENEIARANAADFVEYGWIGPGELEGMPVLTDDDAPVIRKAIRMTQSETRLMEKATYLMDEIIYRSVLYAEDKPEVPLKATMNASLMKDVLGRDYKPILEAFADLEYVRCDETYSDDEAKSYYVQSEIEEVDCPREIERKLKEYQQKTKDRLTIIRKEEQVQSMTRALKRTDPGATEMQATSFLKRYIAGLNKIKIADEPGLNRKIADLMSHIDPEHKEQTRIYYDYISRTLREEKDIYEIDAQGRMYHFLTSLKRELKYYLSISFSLDCKNSHPLLFNHILFISHNVDGTTSHKLSCLLHQLYFSLCSTDNYIGIYHYDGKYIRKYLIYNGVRETLLADFADDELEYIYETSTGLFWDGICTEHPEYDRTDIKQKMFAEVFYSNTTRLVYKEYGKMFKERYPSVYREIVRWKTPGKYPYIQRYLDENDVRPAKPTASLSVALMSLESRIFTAVLASLYRKRFDAVHIHDCIVIPETGNKHQPTQEEVERLMLKEYAKYGIVPTLKAE